MPYVLLLLSFVCSVCFLLGMIKPTLVIHWGAKRTRPMALLYYGGGTVLLLIIAGVAIAADALNKNMASAPATGQAKAAQAQAAVPKLVILKREAWPGRWVRYDVQPELIDGIWPPPKKLLRFAAEDLLDKRKAEDGEYEAGTVRIYYPGRDLPLAVYEDENGKTKFDDYNKFESELTKFRILAAPDGCDKSSEHYKSASEAAETGDPFVFVEKGGPAAMYAGCPELAIEFYTKAIECGMLKTRVEERQVGLDFSAPGEKKKPLPTKKVAINYLALAHGGLGEAYCMAAAQNKDKAALHAAAAELKKALELAGPGEKLNVGIWSRMLDGIKTLAPEVLN